MAQPAKATPEAIHAAIDALVARQEPVTLQSVRNEIGGGSLATIQPVLKTWRAERDAQIRGQSDAGPEPGEASAVPMRVSQALDAAHAGLDQVAQAVVEAINTAIADERRRARLELEAEQKAAERRIAEAEERVARAEAEADQVARDGQEIEAERDRLNELLDTLTAERDRLDGRLATTTQQLSALQAEHDGMARDREALQRRNGELDSDRAAQAAELERLRAELTAERETTSRLYGEVTEAQSAKVRAEEQRNSLQEQLAAEWARAAGGPQ